MQPAVRVRNLDKSYGGRAVVRDLELDIERGECFALLGPNGAGKTTTIEILEGFRSRDSGTVEVLGIDPAHASREWRARVGVVGQGVGAALEVTVLEALRHFAVYHARPRATDELLAAVGLTASADVRMPNLSGGQRRRLDVALGVQGNPELLFLDEPTTGLDPAARRQFWTLLETLRAEGTTILLTTHYLDEAAHLSDRVAVIARGTLLETAPPAELGAALRLGALVRWREGDQLREVRTPTPTETVRGLLAQHAGGEVPELTVVRPSLEDVYLAMIDAADAADAQVPVVVAQ